MLLFSASVCVARCVAASISVPLGHRVYSYKDEPVASLASFNQLTGGHKVSIGNAYGGWFTKELTTEAIQCNTTAATSGLPQIRVHNSFSHAVTVLTCSSDGCSGHDPANPKSYGKCHRQIAVAANATLTLDKGLHYLVLVYNDTYDQECWFSDAYPTELFLPLKDPSKTCATPGRSPVHPWPHTDQYNLDVQPAGASRRAQANVTQWASAPGIKQLTLVVDGRMDLCDEYRQYNMTDYLDGCDEGPDVRTMAPNEIAHAAQTIANTYCTMPAVAGIQVDLEPFSGAFESGVVTLMRNTAEMLRGPQCVDSAHPHGRFISLFAFAESLATPQGRELLAAIKPNGYVVISGYDLYPDSPDSRFNTVAAYRTKLIKQVDATVSALNGSAVSWSLAIPITASAHEYESYSPSAHQCGPACTPYTNDAKMVDYVNAALDVVESMPNVFTMSASSSFRGLTLWQWGEEGDVMQYPPHSNNTWLPVAPSTEVLQVLHNRLP